MEPRGCSRWQPVADRIGTEAAKTAKTVAVGCDQLPESFQGKKGVGDSSPPEGSAKSPANWTVAAPWRTARRSAAGELPPIRIGGTSGQERERLVGAAATFGVGDADGLPCLGAMHDAASADAEHDAAAGDVLQCRELLGGPRGVAQDEHHHADADVDALGARGRHTCLNRSAESASARAVPAGRRDGGHRAARYGIARTADAS
jgi:hypothetical protein